MEATVHGVRRLHHLLVSIHASVMEATSGVAGCPPPWRVSIHASVMEATIDPEDTFLFTYVSIHASVMEATLRDGDDVRGWRCFDPRLRDGGDAGSAPPPPGSRCFDPRLRDGGDTILAELSRDLLVSIHASVMEATRRGIWERRIRRVSIHASVMEATSARRAPSCR